MPELRASAVEVSMVPTANGSGWPGTARAMASPALNDGSPLSPAITPCRNKSAPPSTCAGGAAEAQGNPCMGR